MGGPCEANGGAFDRRASRILPAIGGGRREVVPHQAVGGGVKEELRLTFLLVKVFCKREVDGHQQQKANKKEKGLMETSISIKQT